MEVNVTKVMENLGKYLSKVQGVDLKFRKSCLRNSSDEKNHRSVDAFDKIRRYNMIIGSFDKKFKRDYNNQLKYVSELLEQSDLKLSLPESYYL